MQQWNELETVSNQFASLAITRKVFSGHVPFKIPFFVTPSLSRAWFLSRSHKDVVVVVVVVVDDENGRDDDGNNRHGEASRGQGLRIN